MVTVCLVSNATLGILMFCVLIKSEVSLIAKRGIQLPVNNLKNSENADLRSVNLSMHILIMAFRELII